MPRQRSPQTELREVKRDLALEKRNRMYETSENRRLRAQVQQLQEELASLKSERSFLREQVDRLTAVMAGKQP